MRRPSAPASSGSPGTCAGAPARTPSAVRLPPSRRPTALPGGQERGGAELRHPGRGHPRARRPELRRHEPLVGARPHQVQHSRSPQQGSQPQRPARFPHRPTVGSTVVSAVDLLIAAGVALAAGVIISIAGGGSLILFPTLVALGLPTVAANVTNSVAQWPGYLGGVAGFRAEYAGQRGRLVRFGAVALVGGTAGSVLLLTTPSEAFDVVVPALVLLASLLLAVQPFLTRRLREREDGVDRDPTWVYVALLLATAYGGYFGGAMGVLLVGVLGIALHRLKLANALKSALSAITASVTLVVFGFFGDVHG